MNYGFVKVAAAIPRVSIGDCEYNAERIENMIRKAEEKDVQVLVFPELCITGYTCGDLFSQQLILEDAQAGLKQILTGTAHTDVISILGMPVWINSALYNAAVVISKGKIAGIVPKTYLPNYKEFYERRWFSPSAVLSDTQTVLCGQTVPVGTGLLFETPCATFGIEICEDLWTTIPPSSYLALQGAEIIFNLSAGNEETAKNDYVRSLLSQQSARCLAGYVYASCGFGESTTDVVFAGNGLIYENGSLLAANERFSLEEQLVVSEIDIDHLRMERRVKTTFADSRQNVLSRKAVRIPVAYEEREMDVNRAFSPHPFVPTGKELHERCREIFSIQVAGLAKRIVHTKAETVVVGISGGLDSTLALLVCIKTFDKLKLSRKKILGITMPGFGTTDRTYNNALSLMGMMGVTSCEIGIREACTRHFEDIGHDANLHDTTFENAQARERTQILMDMANRLNGLVIGTGDLSELALGWATFNGDQMSMYGINSSIPKTLVRYLVRWAAENEMKEENIKQVLMSIADTPISPELIPTQENGETAQRTEDLVGPYEIHDFFINYFLRYGYRPEKILFLAQKAFGGKYDRETLKKWLIVFLRRFISQQFKRSSMPDGPKVGSISLSPRGDWRMPSDASAAAWLREAEEL